MKRQPLGKRAKRLKEALRDEISGLGTPNVYHATIVIFLEFFAWGLLTGPVISVLGQTFPNHTLLMNGLIQGVKGFLSFLSAPLIGALSDVWGRKSFLLVSVFFTCLPIPLLYISPGWYFAVFSMSGVFAVTFSVVFAYVADITDENDRSSAYGQVSATFAASFVTSPALGAYLSSQYGDGAVVLLASAISFLDVLFILVAVPESLPERLRPVSWGTPISWDKADPFASLRRIGQDHNILWLCIMVFLSYLPEAGQYSCLFIYLTNIVGFSREDVATFIAVAGVLSVVAQTVVLGILIQSIGYRKSIAVGLLFQLVQLVLYGVSTDYWMMWAAGSLAAMAALSYPAISALVSKNADADQQGAVQGMITGIRGLCNGLGPALYGLVFGLLHVDLTNEDTPTAQPHGHALHHRGLKLPGAPFLIGACMVFLALLVSFYVRETHCKKNGVASELSSHSPRKLQSPVDMLGLTRESLSSA